MQIISENNIDETAAKAYITAEKDIKHPIMPQIDPQKHQFLL